MNTTQDNKIEWSLDSINGLLMDEELRLMMREVFSAPQVHQPSAFWKKYVLLNIKQLMEEGIDNFKTTVNQNYFNWVGGNIKEQRNVLIKNLNWFIYLMCMARAKFKPSLKFKPKSWTKSQWWKYLTFVHLLWEFTKRNDKLNWLQKLSEPLDGSPLTTKRGSLYISQDICNSVLELNSVLSAELEINGALGCVELGAGYGRVAYCLLKMCPEIRYTIIDIPPALYISQWYLSKTLTEKKIFKFRPFKSYSDVKDEIESSDIIFLLPQQVELIPDKSFHLFINISSLHEMTFDQIKYWFDQIDRLCSGYFYTKQWKIHKNTEDNIVVKREDYPVKSSWEEIFNRECTVQPRFFEALYKIR